MMKALSVKEIRTRLSKVIHEAECGESTTITRYGKPVARIVPADTRRPVFPDLSEFRASIKPRGKTLTDTLREMREEERV
ncbi:MAG: type II toxin-antitoxin system prevent-host-death family antitoxin [Phycisphaerae bacterium]|nr:type II toxin-antitoxin system prevent-host-death family antitoxin [Phycisphaerae bacterium]